MKYLLALCGLLMGVISASTLTLFDLNTTASAEEPPAKATEPKPKPEIRTFGCFYGKVTKVGPGGFEIGAGWDGHLEVLKKHNEGNDTPVFINVAGTIVGGDPKGLGRKGDETYSFAALRVGDMVSVDTAVTRAGQQYCFSVIIQRRPGGRIPLLPPNQWGDPAYTSARNQAEQDWEEKGVAIPKKYLDKDGRAQWTNPPYPPVAPMPRASKP